MTWPEHSDVDISDLKASVIIVSDSLFSGENDITNDMSGPMAIEILTDAGINSINLDYYPDEVSSLLIKSVTNPGDTVLILFAGRGGEVEICRKLGRHFIAAELDTNYCEVIEKQLDKEWINFE